MLLAGHARGERSQLVDAAVAQEGLDLVRRALDQGPRFVEPPMRRVRGHEQHRQLGSEAFGGQHAALGSSREQDGLINQSVEAGPLHVDQGGKPGASPSS